MFRQLILNAGSEDQKHQTGEECSGKYQGICHAPQPVDDVITCLCYVINAVQPVCQRRNALSRRPQRCDDRNRHIGNGLIKDLIYNTAHVALELRGQHIDQNAVNIVACQRRIFYKRNNQKNKRNKGKKNEIRALRCISTDMVLIQALHKTADCFYHLAKPPFLCFRESIPLLHTSCIAG